MSVRVSRVPTNINVVTVYLYEYNSSKPNLQGVMSALERANFPPNTLVEAFAEVYGGTYHVSGISAGSYQSYICHTYWAKNTNSQAYGHIICDNGSWYYETL